MFEKKAQRELSVISREIELCEEELIKLLLEEKDCSKNLSQCKKVSELKKLEDYRSSIKKMIELNHNRIKLLEMQKDNKLQELITKSKENKIFETLEEIHFDEFTNEENLNEEKIINEIAVQRYSKEKA
jgi:flagellar export protein FliJ